MTDLPVHPFADRFPMIVAAVESLPVRSCFIDGEAIVVDHNQWAIGLRLAALPATRWRRRLVRFRSDRA